MILTCPQCATRYPMEATGGSVRQAQIRCAKCGHMWAEVPPGPGRVEPPASRRSAKMRLPIEEERKASSPPRSVSGHRAIRLIPSWILVVIAAALAWGAVFYRHPTAQPVPRQPGKHSLGPSSAVTFAGVHYNLEQEAGQPVLVVQGTLSNSGPATAEVPELEAVLYDAAHRPVERWIFNPGVRQLSPGQEANFTMRRPHPPAAANNLSLGFASRRK